MRQAAAPEIQSPNVDKRVTGTTTALATEDLSRRLEGMSAIRCRYCAIGQSRQFVCNALRH
jgi:hypothetical protein